MVGYFEMPLGVLYSDYLYAKCPLCGNMIGKNFLPITEDNHNEFTRQSVLAGWLLACDDRVLACPDCLDDSYKISEVERKE